MMPPPPPMASGLTPLVCVSVSDLGMLISIFSGGVLRGPMAGGGGVSIFDDEEARTSIRSGSPLGEAELSVTGPASGGAKGLRPDTGVEILALEDGCAGGGEASALASGTGDVTVGRPPSASSFTAVAVSVSSGPPRSALLTARIIPYAPRAYIGVIAGIEGAPVGASACPQPARDRVRAEQLAHRLAPAVD